MLRHVVFGAAIYAGLSCTAIAAPTGTDSSTATMPAGSYNTIPTDRTTVNAQKNAEEQKKADAAKPDAPAAPADAQAATPAQPAEAPTAPAQEPSPPPH